jgi:hypothetical protein
MSCCSQRVRAHHRGANRSKLPIHAPELIVADPISTKFSTVSVNIARRMRGDVT